MCRGHDVRAARPRDSDSARCFRKTTNSRDDAAKIPPPRACLRPAMRKRGHRGGRGRDAAPSPAIPRRVSLRPRRVSLRPRRVSPRPRRVSPVLAASSRVLAECPSVLAASSRVLAASSRVLAACPLRPRRVPQPLRVSPRPPRPLRSLSSGLTRGSASRLLRALSPPPQILAACPAASVILGLVPRICLTPAPGVVAAAADPRLKGEDDGGEVGEGDKRRGGGEDDGGEEGARTTDATPARVSPRVALVLAACPSPRRVSPRPRGVRQSSPRRSRRLRGRLRLSHPRARTGGDLPAPPAPSSPARR